MQLETGICRRQLKIKRRLFDLGLRLRPETSQAVDEGTGNDEIHGVLPRRHSATGHYRKCYQCIIAS